MSSEITTTNSVLEQEALKFFDQGVKVFLSDRNTGRSIGRHSEYDPIDDRNILAEMCNEHPEANLEIVADKDLGIIALSVGEGNWAECGEESLQKLTERYGPLDTVAYQASEETSHYLFRYKSEDISSLKLPGIKIEQSITGIPVYPSIVNEYPVMPIGEVTTIRNLMDWLEEKAAVKAPDQEPAPREVASELGKIPPPEPASIEQAPAAKDERDHTSTTQVVEMSHNTLTDQQPDSYEVFADPIVALKALATGMLNAGNDKSAILSKALEWNRTNGVPVQIEDLVSLVEEVCKTPQEEQQAATGKELLDLLSKEIHLFSDEKNEPYFFYEGEAFKAPSADVAARLSYHYLKRTRELPKKKDLTEVMGVLQSRARFDGEQVNLNNRVTAKDQAFYYDLRDKRYLKATAEGWEIIPATFPLFRRYKHMQKQVEPVHGGNPWKVFDFLKVDEKDQLLIMVYIISLFIAKIAHPVLAICGDQGSAKSFFCTVINRLVDPTLTEKLIQPKNERDLIQTLCQKYVSVLDNLSTISDRVSDIFCQVCTGASISLRQLFTDEGENIANFRHVVILNSISLAITNADLMDRSIILKLQRINPQDRRAEDELWESFENARAEILGGIFDAVVRAMAIYPTLRLDRLPRLADFAKWGYAIAEALGREGDQFLDDFNQNIRRQNESVVQKNVLCQAVLRLMADQDTLLNPVADIHAALKSIAGADHKDATFPKLPQNLRAGLDSLRSTLEEHSISYQYLERDSSGVRILITKTVPQVTPKVTTEPTVTHPPLNVPGVAAVALEALPELEFDDMLEVVNG